MDFIMTSLHKLSFDKIIGKVKEMMASTHQLGMDKALDVDNFNEVQFVDLSDELDCKLMLFIPSFYIVLKYMNRVHFGTWQVHV